ncbi:hypothetical protein ES708_17088 [subsurface metagenome]
MAMKRLEAWRARKFFGRQREPSKGLRDPEGTFGRGSWDDTNGNKLTIPEGNVG